MTAGKVLYELHYLEVVSGKNKETRIDIIHSVYEDQTEAINKLEDIRDIMLSEVGSPDRTILKAEVVKVEHADNIYKSVVKTYYRPSTVEEIGKFAPSLTAIEIDHIIYDIDTADDNFFRVYQIEDECVIFYEFTYEELSNRTDVVFYQLQVV